jgi:hypothetical protein
VTAGYLVNIYDKLPQQFWLVMIISFFLGTILVLEIKYQSFRIVGIFVLVLNYFMFLLIPYELGYFSFNSADDLTYLGEIYNIVRTGYINIEDIYPAAHIFYAQTASLLGVQPNILSLTVPSFMSLIFVVGTIILSKLFIKEKGVVFLLIPISLIYFLRFMHYSIAPHYSYFVIMPILLFLLFKYLLEERNILSWSLVILPFILIIPLGHPFITMFAIYVFILLSLINRFFKKINLRSTGIFLSILLVTTFTWLTNCFYLLHFLGKSFDSFIERIMQPVVMKGVSFIAKANQVVSPVELCWTIVQLYGRYLFPIILISIALIIILLDRKSKIQFNKEYKFLMLFFVVMGIIDGFFIFNPIFTHTIQRVTTLNYFIYAMAPLLAISLYILFLRKQSFVRILATAVVLAIIQGISLYGALPSPRTHETNFGVPHEEVTAMRWLFDKKGNDPVVSVLDPQIPSRFCDLFFGWSEKSRRKDIDRYHYVVPDHFGYNENEHYQNKGQYVIILYQIKRIYLDVYRFTKNQDALMRFTTGDYNRFNNDSNANKIFDNKIIELYRS